MVIKRHLNGRTDRRAEELEGKNMTESPKKNPARKNRAGVGSFHYPQAGGQGESGSKTAEIRKNRQCALRVLAVCSFFVYIYFS